MPMPTDGSWPPPQYKPAYDSYRDWDAWYSGDQDKLRRVYSNRGSGSTDLAPSLRNRPSQYAGGLVGTLSRFMWGAPTPLTEQDGRLHVPLASDLAGTAANMLFSEPPKISHEDTAVAERLERLDDEGLNRTLLHAADAASALGDVYLRPVVDEEVFGKRAVLTTVHADGALPVFRWGVLMEVTFWSQLWSDGSTYVRLLEHHTVGRVEYAVYEGTVSELGRVVPLTEHPGSRHLAAPDFGLDAFGGQDTGLDRLAVERIPNAGPQRRWRTDPTLKHLGRSDFDGNEPLFDRLDFVWTSWIRDIRLARHRLVVPEYMLQSNGPGLGATFDPDREVYSALNMMPDKSSPSGITATQFTIRVEEHRATAEEITAVAMRHAGFSGQTLGEKGDAPAVTATEVQARERLSFTTRGNRIQGSWRPGIANAVELLMAVEKVHFGTGPDPVRPNVEFGDSVSDGVETVARTVQLLDAAAAISTDTKVRMVHPDWSDPEVKAEVARIRADAAPAVDPAARLSGLAGQEDPGEE